MRIAMVSEHASPLAALGGADAGGQNVHVASLALALAERGHQIVVHTRRDDPRQPEFVPMAPGIQVHHVPAGPPHAIPKDELLPYLPAFTQQLERQWRRNPPDVVHAHFWMSGVVSVLAGAPLELPVAITFHALGTVKRRHQGDADTSPPGRLDAERSVARSVDAILATATEEIHELIQMGADATAIHLVPCGVDITHFSPSGPRHPARSPLRRLVSVGRLVPRKGVDDAIRMLQWLPNAELLIAGGPPLRDLDDDPEIQRLRAVVTATGATDRVTFLGSVGRAEIPALLRSADLVVCLPWYEPFGLVPLEAMACGVPVVGARVGGLTDSIEDDRTGVLVPPQRPDLAAQAVRWLLDHPNQLSSMARRGPERVAQRFSWQQVAEQTEAAYAEMLSSRLRGVRSPVASATFVGGLR